nr:facilitated trehalose transporter Tret1-like [Rhipicephalus microplus]
MVANGTFCGTDTTDVDEWLVLYEHVDKQYRVLSTCLLLYLLQNITGAQMCLLRAVQVMSNVVVEVPPQFLAIVLVFSHLACTTLATALTPLTNRRMQLGISAFLVAVTLFIFRPLDHLTFTHWSLTEQSGKTSWGAAISIGMLVVAYSVGVCHLPTLLTGELMPSRIRLLGSSIVWSSRWLLAFLVLYFDVDVLTAFQQKGPLLALSLTVAVVAATAIYLIPETEGRSLGQIEHD